jgi:hypothetical protein
VLDYIRVLVWPALVATLVFVYRKQIGKLIADIKHAKIGPAEFSMLSGKGEANLEQAVESAADPAVPLSPEKLEGLVQEALELGWTRALEGRSVPVVAVTLQGNEPQVMVKSAVPLVDDPGPFEHFLTSGAAANALANELAAAGLSEDAERLRQRAKAYQDQAQSVAPPEQLRQRIEAYRDRAQSATPESSS